MTIEYKIKLIRAHGRKKPEGATHKIFLESNKQQRSPLLDFVVEVWL